MVSAKPVVILCGGKGTRLDSYTQKCVTPVAGRPFLHWKLDQLCDRGATYFYLLVAHKWFDVTKECGYSWRGRPIRYIRDPGEGVDTAILHATKYLPFLHWITYGDSILDVPLTHGLPHTWVNDEYPKDAGFMYRWGPIGGYRRHTDQPAVQINTPADMERADENLRRHRATR